MGWSFQQKPPMGWPLDYDSGLVPEAGFWPFNEGSGNKVFDLSGNGKNGSFVGSPIWKPGKYGSGVEVPLYTDYIEIANDPIHTPPKLTVVAYCYLNAEDSYSMVASNYAGVTGWALQARGANNDFRFWVGDGTDLLSVNSLSDPADYVGKWFHIAGTADGTNLQLYLNGKADGNPQAQGSPAATIKTLRFGNDYSTGTSTDFNGIYSYIMLYNRVLSASEIALLYREPFCMFKDPTELIMIAAGQVAGAAGIMTTNTGYWGPIF